MPENQLDDWFWDWAAKHKARFPRADWPPLDSEFFRSLREAFAMHNATLAQAEQASLRLFKQQPSFPTEHPYALLTAIAAIQRETAAARTLRPDDATTHAAWNRAAEANWESLSETEQEEARALVRERVPELARNATWLKTLAMGWAYDPRLVALPPQARAEIRGGFKQAMHGMAGKMTGGR